MYALVCSLRPEDPRMMVRFERHAGEFSQHDFGEVKIRFPNGTEKTIHFFASRLQYSRWVIVTLVDDEGVETLVRRLVERFLLMGGVPLVAVFDRPKTVALQWRKDGEITVGFPRLC